jgi:hypothetical protein
MNQTHIAELVREDPALVADINRPPLCARCQTAMWLTTLTRSITEHARSERRDYECKSCGLADSVEESRPFGKS